MCICHDNVIIVICSDAKQIAVLVKLNTIGYRVKNKQTMHAQDTGSAQTSENIGAL
jgi:hypothetical protein